MKSLVIVTLFILGCNAKQTFTTNDNADSTFSRHLDSIVSLHIAENRNSLDSLFHYKTMNEKYSHLRDEMEIKYLRTGNEKYRNLCNKYDDLKVYYGKKGAEFQRSLSK